MSIVGTRVGRLSAAMGIAIAALGAVCDSAAAQRVLGLDVSRYQDTITAANWQTAFSTAGGNRKFVFIRATRGGTTGDCRACGGYTTNTTQRTLSQRYDDPYFVEWINNSTAAGMFAGAYHYGRADIIASTPNTNGIPNDPVDEANHYLDMAGAWLRPGYLLPMYDFEGVIGTRTEDQLAQFSHAFSDRVFEVTGVRPLIYTNGNHAQNVLGVATNPTPAQTVAKFPVLFMSRYPAGSGNLYQGDIQTALPTDTIAGTDYSWILGPWDDVIPQNWVFWQYSSGENTARTGIPDQTTDGDVAQGDIEFVKDHLIPAIWSKDDQDNDFRDGNWNELEMWNSGVTPIAPTPHSQLPLQLPPSASGPSTLPTPRVAGDPGPGSTSGIHDTVILDVADQNVTVTHSSGSHNIRKLFMRESLNITGGTLTINYDPLYNFNIDNPFAKRSGPISAQFSGAVTMSGGTVSVHTLQVDATQTFTHSGGSLTFHTINLMEHGSNPAKIVVGGNITLNPFNNGNPRNSLTATIANGDDPNIANGLTGFVDLNGGTRNFSIGNGAGAVDVSIDVPIVNGGLNKLGAGTLRLGGANTFSGPVFVNGGTLQLGHSSGLSDQSVVSINNGSTLDMNGVIDSFAALSNSIGQTTGAVLQGTASLTLSAASGSNTFNGVINGNGTLTKNGNASQTLTGNNSFGAINVNAGSLILNGANTTGAVTVNGGTLGGTGSVSGGVVVNSGAHLAPGASIESLGVGSLTLNAGSILDIELGTPGNDQINVAGLLTLNGGSVNLYDFGGMNMGTYTLITYNTLVGDLDSLGTPAGPPGFEYSLDDTGSAITLTIGPDGIEGDFNDDGLVDAADYVVWRKFNGIGIDLPNDGDDLPEAIGPAEYGLWHKNFGSDGSAGGSPGNVPEPAAATLFALGMIYFVGRRCCRS